MTSPANIFSEIPNHLPEEVFEELIQADSLRIERIISQGRTLRETGWYGPNQPTVWLAIVYS